VKYIAIEEHFITEKHLAYLNRRLETRGVLINSSDPLVQSHWASEYPERLKGLHVMTKVHDVGEGRLKDMDEGAVSMAVLSITTPGVEDFDPDEGTAMSRSFNDELAELVKRYPDRYAGLAAIAPQSPEAAAQELERAVTKLGLKGILLNSHFAGGEYLDSQKYWTILEMAEKLDVPIYIHPREPSPAMIKPYLAYPLLTLSMWGFAAEAGLHAMRLICSGVFDKYPRLKIILGHLGESIPFWGTRIDAQWVGKTQKKPSQYFRENFYVTTSGMFWQPALQLVLTTMGADHVLFATDYPYGSYKLSTQFMEALPIADNDKEKICHLNAEKLLRL